MPEKEQRSGQPSSIKFYYEKGRFFRVIHVDGALGALTPNRDIFVSLYNQRTALPRMIEQRLSPTGKLGDEIGRESKSGIFREMEIGLVMSSAVAEEIAKFLLQQVKMLQDTSQVSPNHSTLGKPQ